ncbi:MAG: polysaccharide biosynthesis tyrosine autokinase, partial [Deltaproteobacteria bacterium]|nr:polysaccharide biosynthesis tyrosine autokinase [Deltaproteobacteria bacterium]
MATPTPLRPIETPAPPIAPLAARAPEGLDLRAWLHVLRRRLWLIALITAVVFAGGMVKTLREPKLYSAQVSLVIELQAPKVLGDQVQDVSESQASFWQTKEFFETQFLFLKSKTVASRVVHRLGLDRDEAFLGVDKLPPDEKKEMLEKMDAANVLRFRMRVEPVRDSRVVRVVMDDRDPAKAALLANAVAEEFIQFNLDEKLGTTKAASDWLRAQLDELQSKLATSESSLYKFKRENDILTASLEDSQSIVGKRLMALSDALTLVRKEKAELDAKVKQVREARAAKDLSTLPQVLASPVVQQERQKALQLSEELAEARTRYGEGHPKLLALQERQREAVAEVAREEERIARAVEHEEEAVRDTEANLDKLLNLAKHEAFEVNAKEVDYGRLKREQENNAKVVELVLRRLKDVDLAGLLRTNNVRLLDAAEPPDSPSSPNLKLALVVSLLLGLFGGVSVSLLLEQLDSTIKGQEDVEAATRTAFLGIVPLVQGTGKDGDGKEPIELLLHRKPQSAVAECLRTVRTNLLFLGTERPLARLLVTSSGPQEGKTTAVVGLGVALAQSGQRVLLVDTDMRRPRLHKVFGLGSELGLSSVLLDEKKLGEAIKQTEVPGLSVLPCGPIPPNPAELIHTERFANLAAELSRRYDRVIFDSPPVAAVTDAQILSGLVDGVVLLGKTGKTSRDQLQR